MPDSFLHERSDFKALVASNANFGLGIYKRRLLVLWSQESHWVRVNRRTNS